MASLYIDFTKPPEVNYEISKTIAEDPNVNSFVEPVDQLIGKFTPPTSVNPLKAKVDGSSISTQTQVLELSYADEQKQYVVNVDLGKVTPVDDVLLNAKVFEEYYICDSFTSDFFLTIEYKGSNGEWVPIIKDYDVTEKIVEKTQNQYGNVPRFESCKTIHLGVTAQHFRYTLNRIPKSDEKSQPHLALLDFVYTSDFDENGILYFIGTDGGASKTWKNPCASGKIKLFKNAEKMYNDEMKDYNLIEREDIQSTYFGGTYPQYFTIDLGGEVSVAVTHYTLRHGYKYDNSFLQDFTFSASVDGIEWDILDEQIETPFSYGFQTVTFPVKQTNKFYSYFKLLQKGDYNIPGGKQGAPYMCINGLEIYGQMNVIMKPARLSELSFTLLSYSSKPMTFKHVEDFDTNGILYYIGSNGLTKPWENPAKTGLVDLQISHRLGKLEMNKNNTIGREAIENFWGDSTPIWFSVDLGEGNYVRVTDYTLRHGYGAANSYIHNWEFLGSKDGVKWDVLHNGFRSPFNYGFQTHTFKIKPTKEYYRMFKVVQKGNYYLEGSEGSPFLCIAGFELYGDVLFDVHNITPLTKSLVVKPSETTLTFTHSSDFDTNGLIYYIGTDRLTKKYTNPLHEDKVKLMLSHPLYSDEQSSDSILDLFTSKTTFWGGSSPQWMVIDVGEQYKLNCKAFTLRHGFHVANSYICDWEFQGSNDLVEWDVLYVGIDPPFTKGYDTKTFTALPSSNYYRYFRVLQRGNYSTGDGVSDGAPYLCIDGIELYGKTLIPLEKSEEETETTVIKDGKIIKRFNHVSDGDTNGLIYWIGSHAHSSKFFNPAREGEIGLVISHASMYSPDMDKFDITGRTIPRNCYWGGSTPQWFYVDFGEACKFSCNAYSLRHGYSGSNSFICDWEFSGSNDLENWEVIHSGLETPFDKGFQTVTFKLNKKSPQFRYFRVLQKGNYTLEKGTFGEGGAPYLCINGFEVYGELELSIDQPSKLLNFALGIPHKNPPKALMFPVSEMPELDKSGLFYWLGTKGNTDIFVSPSKLGVIKVTTSHEFKEGTVHDILDRDVEREVYFGGKGDKWFMIDLGEQNNFSCNAYKLRHGGKADCYIQNWELQASNDGSNWETLHSGTTTGFTGSYDSKVFKFTASNKFYRYFRVIQKGESTDESDISLSGFELYGLKNFSLVRTISYDDPIFLEAKRNGARIYYYSKKFHELLLQAAQSEGPVRELAIETINKITKVLPHVPEYFVLLFL